MDEDLRLVVEREHLLLQADVRRHAELVVSLLHPEFTEYGSSGRVWDRTCIAEVTSSSTDDIAMSDVRARRLGTDAVLLTYRSNAAGVMPCGARRGCGRAEPGSFCSTKGTPIASS